MVHNLQVSNEKKRNTLSLTLQYRAATEKAVEEGKRLKRTLKSCFLRGSNSTCRTHIASHHFEEYEKRCNAAIPKLCMNFRCIPKEVIKMREEKARAKHQGTLGFPVVKPPKEFTREAILDVVAKHIACDDQVSLRFRVG
jgi:hypothetical protein